jgi:hypothetical protein
MKMDAKEDSASAMRFAVFGDGKLLWASKPIQKRGEEEECVCDVTGRRQVELRVRCDGSNANAWGAWIDPYLVECDAFVAKAQAVRDKRGNQSSMAAELFWQSEARPTPSPPEAKPKDPAPPASPPTPKRIAVYKVVFPGEVILTTSEQEMRGLQKRYPGEFKGDRGHWAGPLGYAYADRQPGTVLLRRYFTGRRHVFTTRKLPHYREEGLGAWVPERQTTGTSVRLGFIRKKDAAMEYSHEGAAAFFRKLGYHPSGLRFYLFDQVGP